MKEVQAKQKLLVRMSIQKTSKIMKKNPSKASKSRFLFKKNFKKTIEAKKEAFVNGQSQPEEVKILSRVEIQRLLSEIFNEKINNECQTNEQVEKKFILAEN